MMRRFFFALLLICPMQVAAADIGEIIDRHVLPGFDRLASATEDLADAASNQCMPTDDTLRDAFQNAFDAWILVSHLRFGPSEVEDRAFSIYFWPDTRGVTQKTLATMIRDEDPVIEDTASFQTVSVAARGFFALEHLLYDEAFLDLGSADYRCALTRAITISLAANSAAIKDDWVSTYADLMRSAGANDTYRSEDEALRQLFTALSTGLQFTSEARLGRPLGAFDRPRPNRAEARRSARSLRHVQLSLQATRDLTQLMSGADASLDDQFSKTLDRANDLNDPTFAGVVEPQGRFRVEVLQQNVNLIRQQVAEELGKDLGVAAGFNSLDGD